MADRGFSRVEKRCKEAGDRMSESMGESVEMMNRALELVGLGSASKKLRK